MNTCYHDIGMALNSTAIPQPEKDAFGQLGGYSPGCQSSLDLVVPPMAPAEWQAPSNHAASSLAAGTIPPPASGSAAPRASWSPMSLISRPNGKCSYVSPEGEPCDATAEARHWATTHALWEFKEMGKPDKGGKPSKRKKGGKPSKRKKGGKRKKEGKQKPGWLAGAIIDSEAKACLADKYILRCKLGKCAKNPQKMYPRPECLERHMCKRRTKTHAANGFSKEVAKKKVAELCGGSSSFRNRWEEFIYRIHQL